ncbi:uncharacterized protein K460DRAFT_411107 [Cucurbitaria berberidis CBS 394.84]|uniref:DUF7730 domain-containing protein n=1 Tax=Cucurbitaria berberidis CBS 394.84 TaxID=1168544 RepID=A0A9P4G7P1_9PLEO|nr:uncharacterized protein K460DRAFT_411107 [Cucurbitaria berberidis CBS 394.84]KAF1840524.1 hypothetical protein K460DRAFT_411107 [Cucurbitaria berberidis CBS 394.84]
MAPHRPVADERARRAKKVATTSTTTKRADKVVKRPARGYHKFRNGMLNVTPKGGEKELVKNNQMSPLLSLPPEIRNNIWKQVLGGKVFRAGHIGAHGRSKLSVSPTEPANTMALLQTCRQIYAEAAQMPLLLSIFSFSRMRHVSYYLKKTLKPHQRKLITSIQFEVETTKERDLQYASELGLYRSLPSLLPNLEKICVCVFAAATSDDDVVQETERLVRQYFAHSIQGTSAEWNVEQTEQKWVSYNASWEGTATDSDEPVKLVEEEHAII